MSRRTGGTTPSRARLDTRSGLGIARGAGAPLAAAKESAHSLAKRVLGPRRVPDTAQDRITVYHGGVALAALFALGVGIWFVVRLSGYQPISNSWVGLDTLWILRSHGTWLLEGGMPLLEGVTNGSLVMVFGWGVLLVLVPLLSSAALALLMGYVTYRVTRDWWVSLAAALLLASLPVFLRQAHSLQFYPPLLFFGYTGLFCAAAYARFGGRGTLAAAVLGIVGALYSYNIGILFLLIPAVYAVVDRSRPALMRLGKFYVLATALATPWFVWHWILYGPAHLEAQRRSWLIANGYLRIRNSEFWGKGSTSSLEFLEKLPGMVDEATGPLFFLLAALSIVGLIRLPTWSQRAAVLLALAIPVGALVFKAPAAYPKYVYLLLPALVLLSAYGFHGLLLGLSSYPRTIELASGIGMAAIALLGIVFFVNARDEVYGVASQANVGRELAYVATLIDDDRAILGTRANRLVRYRQSNDLLAPRFVSEEDFVTYLSWPSDGAVAEVFARNDVGWVLIYEPAEFWERDYHVWLREAAGQLPRHYLMLPRSSLVETVFAGSEYSLYRVLGDGEGSPRESLER